MSVFRMLRCGDNRHGEGRAKSFYRHIVPPSHCIAAMASIASDKCLGQKAWVEYEARIICRQDSPLICNTVSTTSLHALLWKWLIQNYERTLCVMWLTVKYSDVHRM